MEMADAITINKADGDNIDKANLAKAQYKNALHLFPPTDSGWIPQVTTCSAYTRDGIAGVWEIILDYVAYTKTNGFFEHKRQDQSKKIMFETINDSLKNNFYSNKMIADLILKMQQDVVENKLSSYVAAQNILDAYYKSIFKKD